MIKPNWHRSKSLQYQCMECSNIHYTFSRVFNIGVGGDGIPRHFVFEDLSLMQYKTADRKVGLSYQQLKLALEKLAKWHAATALLSCRVNHSATLN